MKRLILSAIFVYILTAMITMVGCSKKSETELKKEKDSIEQAKYEEMVHELIDSSFLMLRGDSSTAIGTGDFTYHDSLSSYHRGYNIKRDSAYKVENTKRLTQTNELIRKYPKRPGPYLDRGNHYQNAKMYREAISDYNLYIKYDSSNHSAYMNRGNAYERFKIYDSAIADYQKVLELKPDDTIANFNKALIYDILSKYDMAVKEYDTVIIKDMRLAKAYFNRGVSYLALRMFKETARNWEEAIILNPMYEPILRPKLNKLKRLIK
jgi:tetratricopeptide (TPR) repeat protein